MVRRYILALVCAAVFASAACSRTSTAAVTPPANFPLSREALAWGLVTLNYTSLRAESDARSAGKKVLRRGDLVEVRERRYVTTAAPEGAAAESASERKLWLDCVWRTETGTALEGWIPADALQLFPRKEMAETARQTLEKTWEAEGLNDDT